jgi:hypothetical protein
VLGRRREWSANDFEEATMTETTTATGNGLTEQTKALGNQAADEVRSVAHEARAQSHELVDEVRTTLRSEANSQSERVVGSLREVKEQLSGMADGSRPPEGAVADITHRVADEVGSIADRLEQRGVEGTLHDLRSWARRHPGQFLFGAAAIGFVVGRVMRNTDPNLLTSDQSNASAAPQFEERRMVPTGGTSTTSGAGAPAPVGRGSNLAFDEGTRPVLEGEPAFEEFPTGGRP